MTTVNIDFSPPDIHGLACKKAPLQTLRDIFDIFDDEVLDSFTLVSEKCIHSQPIKSCALDPLPTWLLKKGEDELTPVLTLIMNTSL